MSDAAIGWIITVFIAIAGFATKYANDLNIEKKKAEFKLVSDQIERLYGPLNAVTAANEAAWTTFTEKYFPGTGRISDISRSGSAGCRKCSCR